jgi:methylphosphonate synthase
VDSTQDPGYGRRAASLLRAAANDLKRDDRAAEADLGLAQGTFGEYLSGARPVTWDVIQRAAQAWRELGWKPRYASWREGFHAWVSG